MKARKIDKTRLRGTLFVLPAFIIHALVIVVPAFTLFYFSLTDWVGIGTPNFVGLDNFSRMMSDRDFHRAFRNNVVWMSLFLVVPLILGLGMALLFKGMGRIQMVFRAICFLPYVVGSVVAGRVFAAFYSPFSGIGPFFADLGVGFMEGFAPLGDTRLALFAVAFVDNWHWWGFVLVLMMSALHQVDYTLHEAALIEGANPVQIFFRVTLPQIKPTIISYFIFIMVASFRTFDYVWVMTGGGPAGATELVATWIFKRTFISFEAGYGAALSLTVCLGVLTIFMVQKFVRKALNHEPEGGA